ncbi:MAG: FHA domain-containing protein [Anaerolineales bacterium]|nr:FHA domain-containing protein [Anaerolineales bacterium]
MNPGQVMLGLRLALAALLYGFLGLLVWMLWQDVRAAAQRAAGKGRRLGRLLVLEAGLPQLPTGMEFPLLPITSLGRAPTNTVTLPDDTASLEHALLHLRDGQWWLEDLASRNGTRLNDTVISDASPVMPGDVIGIGRVRLKLEVE